MNLKTLVMRFAHLCASPFTTTQVFEWRTAGVKLLSATLCVGSGLPVLVCRRWRAEAGTCAIS